MRLPVQQRMQAKGRGMARSNRRAPLTLLLHWGRPHCQPGNGSLALRAVVGLLALIGIALMLLGPLPASAQADGPQAVPDVPDKPAATAIYEGMVDLEWNHVLGATSYDVQAFKSDWFDLPGNSISIAFYGPGAIIRGLIPESRYYFRVRASNSLGSSDWSEHLLVSPTGGDFGNWDDVSEPTDSRATGVPTIRGTPRVAHTLMADISGIADENGLDRVQFHYQWTSSDGTGYTDIEGATETAYTLSDTDEGKTISVRVSFTDRHGYPESLTSAATKAVGPPNNSATGAPTISGKPWVRETLTADTSGIADEDGLEYAVFNYQWVRNDGTTDTDIQGATGSTYELSDDEVAKTIKVRVFFTDDAEFAESLTSVSTAKVAPIGTCLETDSTPAPAAVAVGAVPIVVESTTDEYFALFVRPDPDSDREIPASVTLGQAGTTTLAENVAALPAERYRVEKYLIANPGDVDGDCIDDITELQTLGSMNPVNPAAAIELSDGALAVPDRETFETLSYLKTSMRFILLGMDTGRPRVYFLNDGTHRTHLSFLDAAGIGRSQAGIERGKIQFYEHLVARDGSPGVYVYWLPDEYSFSLVARFHRGLAASMPLLEDNLAFHIPNIVLPHYQPDLPLYRDSRIDLMFDDDIYGDTAFESLNPGEGYGLLGVREPDERPHPHDIVLYEALPNELPRVAGIISTVPQTPLSHVNLRAVQDGVPNAFIRDALDNADIDDLIDSYVHYTVTEHGWTLRAATPAEVKAHYAASRPSRTQTPERDLTVTTITALGDIEFEDWNAFGVKAANVAVLRTLGFPDGTVPDGFAVPFYFYDEFMKHNGFYDDVEEMLDDPEFQTDYDAQDDELKRLRKKIKKGETPQWMTAALEEMHAAFPEGTSPRYRSSTNNEDLPGFSGAGLYDSKTQHPEETEEDGIAKSLKQVYASLWNFRAFTEREFHRIDHLAAAMGVLVHPNYSDELANGVAVSFDPITGRNGRYYVNTQIGEDLVTNPEAYSVPEEILLRPSGTFLVLSTSNQVPRGQLLMSDAQVAQLGGHFKVIHDEFAELYGIEAGEQFAMEIEFKITSDNVLAIKQARPWVFSDAEAAPSNPNTSATGAPAIYSKPQVGRPLRADTSGIDDEDGLTNVVFSYQWVTNDGTADAHIAGAAGVFYTPTAADVGKAIQVRVSFTDDADNEETLTSAATAVVAAALPTEPLNLTVATGSQIQELDASWQTPASDGGSDITGYRVQWKEAADSWDTPEDVSEETVTGTTCTITGLTGGLEYSVRVVAINQVGEGPASAEKTAVPRETSAPEVVTSRVDGATLRVVYDEALDEGSAPPADAFDVRVACTCDDTRWQDEEARRAVDLVSVNGDTVILTLASPATADDYVVVSYNPPSDEASPRVQDVAGNAAAAIKPTQIFNDTEEAKETAEDPPNSPATGAPTISGTARVGEALNADKSGITDEDGLDNAIFSYQWIAGGKDIDGATGSSYTLTEDEEDLTIQVRVSFTDDADNEETLTSVATSAVAPRPPLTVSLVFPVASHHGASNVFAFDIRFSEEFPLSYETLKFHAFSVTGGEVLRAQRMDKPSNIPWRITVRPGSNGDVTIVLPVTTDCDATGAICTEDGRKLSNRLELTVNGPDG